MGDKPLHEHLAMVYKEMENLKHEQAVMKQKHEVMSQALPYCSQPPLNTDVDMNLTSLSGSEHLFNTLSQFEDEEGSGEEEHEVGVDPCYHYTALHQAWRATNYTTKKVVCDRSTQWKGWYRLFYRGKSIQMPERCVRKEMCGTHSPLWLVGGHPRIRDGVVTRKVCGNWRNNCCLYKSSPIQVKACRGNYYVYKFVKPVVCHSAYCADINTLVCGKCRKSESCITRDRITWMCQKNPNRVKPKIHFFASFPGQISGKMNKIVYRKVFVNQGRAFNYRNGIFRAPVSGVYQFFFSTQTGGSGTTDLWLVVNGYWVAVSHSNVQGPNSVGNLSTYMTTLRKGATVYVTQNRGRSWANTSSNTIIFGGSLLMVRKI
ncbi:Pancreatic secretory granule membrane major glycoprotein GP2 [Triplophysa tibetana]|uniref:Pancreatic secretory granule membrane major glycoprotein GP2 n=1 Tax=Triplophysa tibetana TaxID=1572043 RepID=A0A5A9PTY8_9TELE|nr:Pancreatic secretory granule membrane major glycoprotein GP2 [Triplophysa tibetana]